MDKNYIDFFYYYREKIRNEFKITDKISKGFNFLRSNENK